jgi:hypothetical protein
VARAQRVGADAWREAVLALLQQAIDDGEIRTGLDPALEVESLLVLLSGLGVQFRAGPPARSGQISRRLIHDHLDQLRRTPA